MYPRQEGGKKMNYEVVVGFSVNPEISWTKVPAFRAGQKLSAQAEVAISGTSLDVCLGVQACGSRPLLIGAVGLNDPFNMVIEVGLQKQDIAHLLLPVRKRTCLASIEPETERHLSFKPPVVKVEPAIVESALKNAKPEFQVVTGLMSDRNEIALAETLLANGYGIKVLNPREALTADKKTFERVAALADWLFLNRFEAAAYLDCQPNELTLESLKSFLALGVKKVIVTCDGDGALAADCNGWSVQMPSFHFGEKVGDKGAGDCLLGFYLGSLIKGYCLNDAFQLAIIAAGIKVTRPGTTNIPSFKEVLAQVALKEVG